ncbi:unnamed protein product [Rotaria sordida]|uniref:F-box domain-containing protein n=1 Tax=Rotaria sordida TaxID=392033 RepID=A0A818T9B8_9BILA|nr:unnamed protein product [Rotaria sordida]CAF3683929.1 unnamed protein product [Rotaria sordida]
MNRIKRRQNNNIVHQNKKQVTNINTKKSIFENLANEIIYEIFEYIDTYDVYYIFFNLNKRFENLFLNSNLPLQINISTISKSKFEDYHQNIIIPNRHRIDILRLSNPFTVDIIFSPPRIILKFIQLKTLVLDNIDAKYLKNILNHSIHLSKLHSLTIHLIDFIKNSTDFYLQIFRLPKLKYCKIKLSTMDDLTLSTNIFSSIEHLVINTCFPYESFHNLLSYLPQLRYLSIDVIYDCYHKPIDFSPIVLKSLKYISLKLSSMNFNQFEQIVKNFFHYIEVLHITSSNDSEFLNAKRWEKLILSSMSNLRIFDINHSGLVGNNSSIYHDVINEFNSSFWILKQWFFKHQHSWEKGSDSGIFYSTNPYRRKDYKLYCQINKQICLNIQENNLNLVKHLLIGGKQIINNSINYFINVNELTIKDDFKISHHSISTILNQIISLKQLIKLNITHSNFSIEQLMKLLHFTPNLHTIKYFSIFFNGIDLTSIKKIDLSTKNQVKKLEIYHEGCTIEEFQIILNIFPQLEYFKIGMSQNEIEQFIPFLASKTYFKTHSLFFLCISQLRKRFIPELNRLIKSKNLHDNYLIKIVYCDLYLWW